MSDPKRIHAHRQRFVRRLIRSGGSTESTSTVWYCRGYIIAMKRCLILVHEMRTREY